MIFQHQHDRQWAWFVDAMTTHNDLFELSTESSSDFLGGKGDANWSGERKVGLFFLKEAFPLNQKTWDILTKGGPLTQRSFFWSISQLDALVHTTEGNLVSNFGIWDLVRFEIVFQAFSMCHMTFRNLKFCHPQVSLDPQNLRLMSLQKVRKIVLQ